MYNARHNIPLFLLLPRDPSSLSSELCNRPSIRPFVQPSYVRRRSDRHALSSLNVPGLRSAIDSLIWVEGDRSIRMIQGRRFSLSWTRSRASYKLTLYDVILKLVISCSRFNVCDRFKRILIHVSRLYIFPNVKNDERRS